MVSIVVLLMLSLLSLFSVSLFRTGLNSQYIMRNEVAYIKSFNRAQEVVGQISEIVFNIDDSLLISAIAGSSNELLWLSTEKDIDFAQINFPLYWKQLNVYPFPPDAQAIVVFLDAKTIQTPSESMVMTHDKQIQSYRFSIIAKAKVSGGIAVVESGIIKRIIQ